MLEQSPHLIRERVGSDVARDTHEVTQRIAPEARFAVAAREPAP